MTSSIPDYEPISLRGAGCFGYVIEAMDRIHNTRVAIKRTHKVDILNVHIKSIKN